jgi:hypothetical protein
MLAVGSLGRDVSRSCRWQRHAFLGSCPGGLLPGLRNIPLADTVSAAAFRKINMNVVLVIAIRARPQHGGESRAQAFPQVFPKVFWNTPVCELQHLSVREPQGMQINRIGLSVLGNLGAGLTIAITAVERAQTCDGLQGTTKLPDSRSRVFAYPACDSLGHRTADDGRWVDGNTPPVGQNDGLEANHIGSFAFSGSLDGRQRRCDGPLGGQTQPAS